MKLHTFLHQRPKITMDASEQQFDRVRGGGGRRNMKLAIPRSLSVSNITKQRRVARRNEKTKKQCIRALVVTIPLALILFQTETIRQRALSRYMGEIEDQLYNQTIVYNQTAQVHVGDIDNKKNAIDQYPFTSIANVTALPKVTFGGTRERQTNLFWQIPRTGATTLKEIMGTCLHLVQASRTSADFCDVEAKDLHVCRTRIGAYINCDTSDDKGIQRCRDLDLVKSGLPDIIVSSRFLNAASLFDEDHLASAFTIMRDPIDRMASTFHYLREAKWERQYSESLKNITLLEYAKLEDTPRNWMVRWLTGQMTKAKLDDDDLELAKEIIEKKFFILLTNEMKASVDMLIKHNRFKLSSEGRKCIEEKLKEHEKMESNDYPPLDKEGEEYAKLKEMNSLDSELYEHALKLFTRQFTSSGPSLI